jgi:hypothetical protein
MEFRKILDLRAEKLVDLIRREAAPVLEERVFGRFKFSTDRTLDLDSEYEFRVESISLSGMLIKTKLLPSRDSMFDMEIQLPDETIELRGRVAYVTQETGTQGHLAKLGVEFSHLTGGEQERLTSFIEQRLG